MSKIPPVGSRVPPEETFVKKEANKITEFAKKIIIPVTTEGEVTSLANRVAQKTSQLYEKIHTATRPK